MIQGASRMMRGIGGALFAMQLGQVVGQLATEVVSGGDIGIPLQTDGRAALVPQNVAEFGDGLDIPTDQVELYLSVRELAHARLFRHARWLRLHLITAITAFAKGIDIDTDRLEQLAEGFDPSNTEELRDAVVNGALIRPKSEGQEAALGRLETMLALVEGWVDAVDGRRHQSPPEVRRDRGVDPATPGVGRSRRVGVRHARRTRAAPATHARGRGDVARGHRGRRRRGARRAVGAPRPAPDGGGPRRSRRASSRGSRVPTPRSPRRTTSSTRRSSSCCAARPPRRPARTARSRPPDGPSAASAPTAVDRPCGRMPRGRPRRRACSRHGPAHRPRTPPRLAHAHRPAARRDDRPRGAARRGRPRDRTDRGAATRGERRDPPHHRRRPRRRGRRRRARARGTRAGVRAGDGAASRAGRRSAAGSRAESPSARAGSREARVPRVVMVDADGVLGERLIADLTALGYHVTVPPSVDGGRLHDEDAADRHRARDRRRDVGDPSGPAPAVAPSRRAAPRRRVRRHRGARRSARRARRRAVPAVPRPGAPRRRPRVAGDRRPAGGPPGRDGHHARLRSRRRRSRSPSSTTGSRTVRRRWRMPR